MRRLTLVTVPLLAVCAGRTWGTACGAALVLWGVVALRGHLHSPLSWAIGRPSSRKLSWRTVALGLLVIGVSAEVDVWKTLYEEDRSRRPLEVRTPSSVPMRSKTPTEKRGDRQAEERRRREQQEWDEKIEKMRQKNSSPMELLDRTAGPF